MPCVPAGQGTEHLVPWEGQYRGKITSIDCDDST